MALPECPLPSLPPTHAAAGTDPIAPSIAYVQCNNSLTTSCSLFNATPDSTTAPFGSVGYPWTLSALATQGWVFYYTTVSIPAPRFGSPPTSVSGLVRCKAQVMGSCVTYNIFSAVRDRGCRMRVCARACVRARVDACLHVCSRSCACAFVLACSACVVALRVCLVCTCAYPLPTLQRCHVTHAHMRHLGVLHNPRPLAPPVTPSGLQLQNSVLAPMVALTGDRYLFTPVKNQLYRCDVDAPSSSRCAPWMQAGADYYSLVMWGDTLWAGESRAGPLLLHT